MQVTSSYEGGLNKDLAYLKYPKNKYYHMENFRIVTSEGSSTAAIEVEKGNRLDFQIPDTTQVIRLFVDPIPVGEFRSFRINGVQFTLNSSTTLQTVYDLIISVYGNDIGIDFNIDIVDDSIFLFGLNNFEFESNIPGEIINFIEVVPALTNLRIIHLDHFNDKIVVFTTSNTLNTTNADGQIWLVEYNEESNIPTNLSNGFLVPQYHLKYNNLINLSTSQYIRKSICRYENNKTARVYFTDFYNPARSFNLFDPKGYLINPSDLDFVSNVTFTKPIIKDIESNGSIPTGSMVQFFYQLVAGGKETIVSPGSDLLPLYEKDSKTATYIELEGSPQNSVADKSVSYTINDIDPTYQFIRHIAVIYEFNNIPVIKQFKEEIIPASKSLDVVFTNDEQAVILSEQELNILNSQFSTCKDLTHKDNRLIAVNTKSSKFEITDEEFDSRTYRFKADQTSIIKDKSGNLLSVDNTYNVPFTHDAINPYNNNNDVDFDLFKYQLDGITLGGEGPNISYSFITKQILIDERGQSGEENWAGISGNTRTEIVDNEYIFEDQFNHFKSPYIHMLYGGYMRDEVYRFGIVFYDKKGNVSFTKWISDVRFPTIQERPLDEIVDGKLYANQLGIQFTVNIPTSIENKISGYEIVRVERDLPNRTRLTGGLFMGVTFNGNNLVGLDVFTNNTIYNGAVGKNIFSFISPWHQFRNTTKPDFKTDDYIDFDLYYTSTMVSPTLIQNTISTVTGYLNYRKFRNNPGFANWDVQLKNSRYVGRGSSFNINNDLDSTSPYNTYENTSQFTDNPKYAPHFVFAADSPITVPVTNATFYGTYCRDLAKQYGGNSYEERSNNTYISTSKFISGNQGISINVFGGDTYCNHFDFEHLQGNDVLAAPNKRVQAVMFTCESPFNVDLRHGKHFSDDRKRPDDPDFTDYTAEQYFYNPVYLQENTIKQQFIAKPFNVNLDDEQPYAIWVSELKQNGEQIDSWVKFKVNNQIEVDGIYGPINGVINHQGRVFFFQNEALGVVPINERVVTQNEDGIELALGTGDVISSYGYISTRTGCFHTSAIVQSEDYFYFFDVRTKKFYRMSMNSKEPLSDVKGLSAHFNSFVKESLLENNDTKTDLIPIGIHGCYEPRYNRVLFTFSKGNSITISYNEFLNSFESFYSFEPCIYLSTGRKLLSVNGKPFISNRKAVYQHDVGDYSNFYGTVYDSKITHCLNGESPDTKEWNNLTWYSECYDNNLNDVPDETFTSIRVYNDHQTTGSIPFTQSNINRRFRYWKHAIKRDVFSYQQQARIRNPWIFIELIKDNQSNNRFIAHDLTTYYLF